MLRQGKGPPVLFIHGANGVGPWLPFFEKLSTHYDLLIPDHPGFGRSDVPAWIKSVPDLAFFYLDFIEKL
ncbi:MAG: alpha/beta fold hydrolase, partial [Rhizobiales bacterium]|nr:alpha/beta fold hydrolase [Hyphomicrobiales bacterium]